MYQMPEGPGVLYSVQNRDALQNVNDPDPDPTVEDHLQLSSVPYRPNVNVSLTLAQSEQVLFDNPEIVKTAQSSGQSWIGFDESPQISQVELPGGQRVVVVVVVVDGPGVVVVGQASKLRLNPESQKQVFSPHVLILTKGVTPVQFKNSDLYRTSPTPGICTSTYQ